MPWITYWSLWRWAPSCRHSIFEIQMLCPNAASAVAGQLYWHTASICHSHILKLISVALTYLCAFPQVGAATAYYDFGVKLLGRTGALLLGSIFIIAWLNLRSVPRLTSMPVSWLDVSHKVVDVDIWQSLQCHARKGRTLINECSFCYITAMMHLMRQWE